jgi:hypothetical protein
MLFRRAFLAADEASTGAGSRQKREDPGPFHRERLPPLPCGRGQGHGCGTDDLRLAPRSTHLRSGFLQASPVLRTPR